MCPSAMLCVKRENCDFKGFITDQPLINMTPELEMLRVPLIPCVNPENQNIDVCCRDPNYVDPWQAMMNGNGGNFNNGNNGNFNNGNNGGNGNGNNNGYANNGINGNNGIQPRVQQQQQQQQSQPLRRKSNGGYGRRR